MNLSEFNSLCGEIFAANPHVPPLDVQKSERLYILMTELLETNKVMNLTALKDERSIILKHFVDSLAICDFIPLGASLIDVGCGAGFPTLPLAIFRPDVRIVALDSTAKRIEYVQKTAKKLGLNSVDAIAGRAEVIGNAAGFREKFDVVTARAVAALPILCELCLPLVRVGGVFVAMKSQKASDEIESAAVAITKCGGSLKNVVSLPLCDIDGVCGSREIVVIEKVSNTPRDLPRHYSKISKKPLA